MPKFDTKYTYNLVFREPNHVWSIVGALGGIHLWMRSYKDSFGRTEWQGGVEQHRRSASADDDAPNTKDCWLIGGPCWHDGSSLAADRFIAMLPHDESLNTAFHEMIWRALEAIYAERFGGKDNA